MKPEWNDRAWDLHQRCIRVAQRKGRLQSEGEDVNLLTLAICGEVGKLADLTKRRWRGEAVLDSRLAEEVADIRIYLEMLARHLSIDLDGACERKLLVVEE